MHVAWKPIQISERMLNFLMQLGLAPLETESFEITTLKFKKISG